MKIKALIALWQRPEITKLCFEGVERLKKFGIDPICIYSDKDNERLVKEFGFEGYYHENQPLGRKLNFGLKKALESDWDYFTQIGSDDLISDKLFEIYAPYFERQEIAFGLNRVHFYNMYTGEAAEGYSSYPFGCARMLHRSVFTDYNVRYKVHILQSAAGLDFRIGKGEIMLINPAAARRFEKSNLAKIVGVQVDDRPFWDNDKNKTLDFDSEFTLNTKGITVQRILSDEILVIDLKTNVNLWPFEQFEIIDKDILQFIPERNAIREVRQIHYNTEVHHVSE